MDIMRKFFCTVSVALTLVVFPSCSNSSQESSSKSYSAQNLTEASQSSEFQSESEDNELMIGFEPKISETLVESTKEISTYSTINADFLSVEDKDTIQAFCDDMCHKWARMYNNIGETDFSDFVQYDSLCKYIEYSVNNSVIESISYSNDTHFDLTALDFDNGKAIAKGIYKDKNGAYGEYIYIIVNENGNILLNDMAINAKNSLDSMYRLDFIQSPYPDYWSDYSNYSNIANHTYNNNS
ncbi:MAG: hypothetical protein K2J39_10420 [Ruminococcus sp.]|nr:hypothetical protein [Ruminococcus sp.]